MTGINEFDRTVMEFVQRWFHNPVTDAAFPFITYLGESGLIWIALAVVFLCLKKFRKSGALMLCAMAAGFLLGELLLKNIVCRERPFQTFPAYTSLLISPPSGFSFPSGHTCSSFAAATVLCFHSRKWGIPALILAALIGFSRIFLFVHWPTDVLAGLVLGVAMGLLTCFAAKKWESRKTLPSQKE